MNLKKLRKKLYLKLIEPNAKTEDDRRRAYIFNILMTGTLAWSLFALVSSAISKLTRGTKYDTVPLAAIILIIAFFSFLLYMSKKGWYRVAAVIYIAAFFVIATYPIVIWGILLPQAILTYCLIIVVAGVLLNSRAAFIMTAIMTGALLFIEHLEATQSIHFDTAWMKTTGGYNDVVVYGITFAIVALVSWLSNRQIEFSLKRARKSEQALRVERNMLEVRVRERTEELERSQAEKLEELNRFAEFGRISSTLIHELANPLTSAMLNLELMKNKERSKLYQQLHESITYMDGYITNARRQLRQQSEIREFNVAEEIDRVIGFLQPNAQALRVSVETKLDKNLVLNGDTIKFSQIISNLLVNAIHAYESLSLTNAKPIEVTLRRGGKAVEIIINDFGVGIPNKDIKRIFEPFYTTKLSDRGTGLGLTITKRAVEEDFGGSISVVSTKRGGTQFTIRMPL